MPSLNDAQYLFFAKKITRTEYNANAQIEYVGFADPGTADDEVGWAILKTTYHTTGDGDGQEKKSAWANGDPYSTKHVFDSRASYSYS